MRIVRSLKSLYTTVSSPQMWTDECISPVVFTVYVWVFESLYICCRVFLLITLIIMMRQ